VERTGRALLELTEDTAEEAHRTIHYICEGLQMTREERRRVYSKVICHPMAGQNCCLLGKDSNGAMVETPLLHALEKKIRDFGDVAFVGLDPALSINAGDEMDQGHQRALGRMVDNCCADPRTAPTPFVLHLRPAVSAPGSTYHKGVHPYA